jgi:hypothetical protein
MFTLEIIARAVLTAIVLFGLLFAVLNAGARRY